MKRNLLFSTALFFGVTSIAQTADFENQLSQSDTAWFGQDQDLSNSMVFDNGDFEFENTYTVATWGTYSQGWSYSNITDNTTSGSLNDKSAFTGSGDGSVQYGICNVSSSVDHRIFASSGLAFTPTEVKITNATYTALSMQDGDMFAAQFGDINNASAGEDSLVLTVYGLDANGNRQADSVNVYLADFTNGNNLIVNTWLTIDLTSLGSVNALDFGLISSDNGTWGMNTPSYFAMDNLQATGLTDGDFETTLLSSPEDAWFGQDQTLSSSTTFTSGFYDFENTYNVSQYGPYSSGWSYSNITDVTTTGSTNQYSAFTGSGESSTNYGICNASEYSNNRLFSSNGVAFTPTGSYFTNTTYAALSMQNGDAFATEFGDVSNAAGGEDWFLLTVYGLDEDSIRTTDSVNFYLADYRFTNDTEDYIIDEWTWVDLSSIENVYGLDFVLSSSDNNSAGMLTPAYFAMDNFDGTVASIETEANNNKVSIYPNPTTDELHIYTTANSDISLLDINGKTIKTETANSNNLNWNISDLENGVYILVVNSNGINETHKIVKK
jgi:hypothetical protein